ncbi:peroxisomal succinyl-coenzyme A thioesterase-like isoform X4 [Girardinichthys multiradiatus]|nr:peroxisomal succinyl-coenzyme A thioesterase-like isoform X4 [Girardinichthys multiradiatus]XP_047203458.1 peroxisomal succinyl-coenzyme A thioesterase-like isoform X4 [Girardinichthys multiradiatus]XP_047203466.1 peroxisomal succinyl-coenzyme A thioesterase-like isoform X4 [Girardinichthys multiradiatus]XP_047203472.1 peroxisomal succinyl-coenzyme A thioesterase-like isoform X4 [Girardinichthys multiradiatus]
MDNKQCCVTLSVQPSRGLVDEKFVVLVQNTLPSSLLTIHALHRCEDAHSWHAFAHYTSDATGAVNVSEDCSMSGTYSGVEAMGLLWSLKPVPGSKPGLRMRKKNVQAPMVVTISVYKGHLTEDFGDRVPLASVEVERWYMAPGVRRIPVTEDGLTATLFLPSGPGRFPGILDLWGGGGQLVEYRAALLASHGIATMALDYLTCKYTMETGKIVEKDYFETAYKFLQKHPKILGSRIAMLGLSLGTSVTLKMAVYSDVVKLRCAVCINGSHVQPMDGFLNEMLNYFTEHCRNIHFTKDNEVVWRDILLPIPTDLSRKVDVGKLQCPLMLIIGEDDQNWCPCESAIDMKVMMEQAGNSHLLTVLSYPNAGHLIEPPYTPHARSSLFKDVISHQKFMVLWGGQTLEHSRAQEDAWRKLLVFLRKNLYGDVKTGASLVSNL